MKKVLLTTTALTLLAGAAAAEVGLSGYGRIGVIYNGVTTVTYNRVRLNVSASTEADNGLTFGAWFRAQATSTSPGASAAMALSGGNVWVSNGMGTLTLGNTGGAVSAAANIFGCGVGFQGACNDMADNSFTNMITVSSTAGGPNTVRVDFTLGSANLSVSGGRTAAGLAQAIEVAGNFAVGGANIGLGYTASAVSPTTWANVSFDAGSATVGIRSAFSGGATGYIAHITYAMGAGSIYAYGGNNLVGSNEYGVEYTHSLGGGVSAMASVISTGGVTMASAGAHFNF